jgi:photosystem II stability/assembly factor-like uncharacterized protein
MVRRIVAIALVLLGLVPTAAQANGRYPSAITLHFKPGSTRDIVVGATWGMLITSDGGATWRWSCEDAVGYGGTFDPDYAVSNTGRIFATTAAEGLRHTDDGCTWSSTQLGVNLVSSVTVAPGGDVWAAGYAELDYRIFRSDDDGATFEPVALTGRDEGAWWESLEVAPGDDQRVYLAGYRFVEDTKEFLLYRSDNGGGAWRALPVTAFAASSQSLLQIVAISPDDPDLVFARLTRREGAVGDAIYRSDDAGESWRLVLEPGDAMAGIAVRAVSGGPAATTAEVIVSTPTMGSHRSTNGGVDFVPAPASPVKGCLVERPGDRVLIGCGDNLAPDLVGLTQSSDGLAWTTLLQFRNVTAPIACAEGTEQRDVCQEQLWCGMKEQLSIVSDVIACPSTGVDAGLPDAGGGDDDGGGGCCDGGAGASGLATALLLLAAGSAARRRRN